MNDRAWRPRNSTVCRARKLWPKAEWIEGNGRYATVASCGVLTVMLHRTRAKARQALAWIDELCCGGQCRGIHAMYDIFSVAPSACLPLDPILGPYCCDQWAKARRIDSDSWGEFGLIWVDGDSCLPRMGNSDHDTALSPVRFCPWCGHDWQNNWQICEAKGGRE